MNKGIRFNEEKNLLLKETRGVCFDDVIEAIEKKRVLDDLEHPNKKDYPNQKVLVVSIDNYAYVVPYIIEKGGGVFLKTVFPNRKLTRRYIYNE